MCQKIAQILWDGRKRKTCPDHNKKLRCESGCPDCGWSFAGQRGKQNVTFVQQLRKRRILQPTS
jgi:hypothetical protein